ncbi:alpha-(1,3)-fucosyltransferase C-like [Uloborus diversus]|uniref:alpha-(1,3)-fucosyltransferase C-like n=1 Tax=Uloborus diversus TaxID=327109 RepID=UPI002409F3A5|nr:alpha-(1,3)-fucosyltransferase C-like [Uloborus diversus]
MKIFKTQLRSWRKSLLLCVVISTVSFLLIHFLFQILTLLKEESWFDPKKVATIDPWVKKHWKHVKIVTKPNRVQTSKTILLWTKFFGISDYVPKLSTLGCPKPKCFITSDRRFLNKSDALVFHLRDINLKDLPAYRNKNQVWILVHHESPHHTPDVLKYLNGLFNWTATYRSDSDIGLTPVAKRLKHADSKAVNYARGKKRMVAWLVSNCKTPSKRELFVKELQKSILVDIYGKCGKLSCFPVQSEECYEKLGKMYRFYLSFENSICKDYVTEKFFNILHTNMIPVVMGGANYSAIAPPSSYIDALSFKSPKELAQFLLNVAKDEKKFNSYFAWKNTHYVTIDAYACQICKKLHEPLVESHYYKNISYWWFGDANCKSWNIFP